jgi:hypothetical protein
MLTHDLDLRTEKVHAAPGSASRWHSSIALGTRSMAVTEATIIGYDTVPFFSSRPESVAARSIYQKIKNAVSTRSHGSVMVAVGRRRESALHPY